MAHQHRLERSNFIPIKLGYRRLKVRLRFGLQHCQCKSLHTAWRVEGTQSLHKCKIMYLNSHAVHLAMNLRTLFCRF
jgi:hypothetical protein